MPKFTSIEGLFNQAEQSVGPYTEGNELNEILRVFQPEQGIDVLYRNPLVNNDSTEIVDDMDGRIKLGTFTLNNRGFWEDINFNESTFQPYLTDDKKTVDSIIRMGGNGDEIVDVKNKSNSSTYDYSIDALPFVTNPNDGDEIIRVDRYWDKKINSTEHYLATEGKIKYYLYPRGGGRLENGNIDLFSLRRLKTASGGKNRFTVYAEGPEETGFYLFKLNWGDGSSLEYTDEPKLLEGTTLLDHTYEKPGFYTISGVVYVSYKGEKIDAYEKFETNILLNPSKNYELNLYDYDNFATIGGITNNSVLVKSATNILGINPLDFNTSRASVENIEKLNLLDKINLFNFLNKISNDSISLFDTIYSSYSQEIYDTTENIITETIIYGCMDSNADTYNSEATIQSDGSCSYSYKIITDNEGSDTGFAGGVVVQRGNIDDDGYYVVDALVTTNASINNFYPEINYGVLNGAFFADSEDYHDWFILSQVEVNGAGVFQKWNIPAGIEWAKVNTPRNSLLPGNSVDLGDWGTNENNLTDSTIAIRALEIASSVNFNDKVVNAIWYESTTDSGGTGDGDSDGTGDGDSGGTGYDGGSQVVDVIGQDLKIPEYASEDEDEYEYDVEYDGTIEYPREPQPVQVTGAPYTGASGIPNQSSLGLVGPTNFILMDNTIEYAEPGHPFEGSEIDLDTRIIEARPNEEFVLDDVTYTQSFVGWRIIQGLESIKKIFNDHEDGGYANIILTGPYGSQNEINVNEYNESVKKITIQYSNENFDPEDVTPIIIEGYFLQEGDDGSSETGKYPQG